MDISTKRSAVSRLPAEILLMIFSEFAWDGSEPSVGPGYDCWWFQFVRMRKTILSVCRTWYHVALPSLYSFVYFHRVAQLPAFLRTLDERLSAKRGISHWVQHIICRFYVPPMWERVFRDSIVRLVTHCRTARKLVYSPIFDERIAKPHELALLRVQPFDEPFPGLSELSLGEDVLSNRGSLRAGLSCFQELRKLRLEIKAVKYEPGAHNDVFLPNLEVLACAFISGNVKQNAAMIARHWTLPQLRDLSVNVSLYEFRVAAKMALEILCSAHGACLRSLRLSSKSYFSSGTHSDLRQVFRLCPALTLFTYCEDFVPFYEQPINLQLLHSSLQCVSFLSTHFPEPYIEDHLAELSQRLSFPSLDTIILLDPRLRWKIVDGNSLPVAYANTLYNWSAKLASIGIRLLNCESEPFRIVLADSVDVELYDTNSSDDDFSNDDSSDWLSNCDENDECGGNVDQYTSSDSDGSMSEGSSAHESIIFRRNGDDSAGLDRPAQLSLDEALEIFESSL